MIGSPVRIDGDRADSDLPPPALGQHTDEVLASNCASSPPRSIASNRKA